MSLSATDIENIGKALQYLAQLGGNFSVIYATWDKETLTQKVLEGMGVEVILLNIVALFFPPAALASQGVVVLETFMPFIIMGLVKLGTQIQYDKDNKPIHIPQRTDSWLPSWLWSTVPASWDLTGSGMHFDPKTGRFEKKTI